MQEPQEVASSPTLLTIQQVACCLGVCRGHVHKLIRDSGLPITRLGRRVFVHQASLSRWLADQEQVSPPS